MSLCQASEAFYPIDMSCASDEFVLVMTDTIKLLVTHVHDPVVGTKAICMNGCREINSAPNNGRNTGSFAVRDDLCVDTNIPLIAAEDDGLASRPASALASDTTRAK